MLFGGHQIRFAFREIGQRDRAACSRLAAVRVEGRDDLHRRVVLRSHDSQLGGLQVFGIGLYDVLFAQESGWHDERSITGRQTCTTVTAVEEAGKDFVFRSLCGIDMHAVVFLHFALEEVDILGVTVVVDGIGERSACMHMDGLNNYTAGRNDDVHFLACRERHFHLELELGVVLVSRVFRVDHVVIHEGQPEVIAFGGQSRPGSTQPVRVGTYQRRGCSYPLR